MQFPAFPARHDITKEKLSDCTISRVSPLDSNSVCPSQKIATMQFPAFPARQDQLMPFAKDSEYAIFLVSTLDRTSVCPSQNNYSDYAIAHVSPLDRTSVCLSQKIATVQFPAFPR